MYNLRMFYIFLYLFLRTNCGACEESIISESLELPPNFKFGAETAAFGIEGGWNADGKGPSIWDFIAQNHTESIVSDQPYNVTEQAEVAADSYHKWQEDVKIAQELGLSFYRFSISWTRILPRGFSTPINQAGVDYYNKLINALIEAKITPVATLLYYDTNLIGDQFLGSLANPVVIENLVEYADLAFRLFGDRVQQWVTFNSPYYNCKTLIGEYYGSTFGYYFPSGQMEYLCAKNVLLANAKIYQLYQKKYKAKQKGQIGLSLEVDWYEPASNSPEDSKAVQRALDFQIGWFLNPIVFGNYPESMIKTIAEVSKKQNYTKSRLPSLSSEEIKEIRGGKVDFYILTSSNTYVVSSSSKIVFPPTAENDVQITRKLKYNDSNSLYQSRPSDFRKAIKYVYDKYKLPAFCLSAAYAALNDSIQDYYRINYLQNTLQQVALLIQEDKVPVETFSVFSLIDVNYFHFSYKYRFGLAQINIEDPERARTLRASAYYFKQVIQTYRESQRMLISVESYLRQGSSVLLSFLQSVVRSSPLKIPSLEEIASLFKKIFE